MNNKIEISVRPHPTKENVWIPKAFLYLNEGWASDSERADALIKDIQLMKDLFDKIQGIIDKEYL